MAVTERGTSVAKPNEESGDDSPARRRLSSSVRGVRRGSAWVRNRLAALVWLLAALCAAVLAIGALLVAFDANPDNSVYQWFTDTAQTLAGPVDNLFQFDDEAKQTLVNWGIAALAYLVIGRILQRIIKP